MKAVRVIVNIVTALALVFSFVGAGFAVCSLTPLTHGLAWVFSDDSTSPFDRNQLARVADATRDYSFGNHKLLDLYQTIYEVDVEYRDGVGYSAASVTGSQFPKVAQVTDTGSLSQLRTAFEGASEVYCYSQDAISHLDECYTMSRVVYPLLIAAAILSLAGLIFTGVTGKRRRLGIVFLSAGIIVVVAFVALAAWAIVDFQGFFATFHNVFFSQGNWQFPYDSLLICALPAPFWAGMGAIWLLIALLLSITSILIGSRLVSRKHGKHS